MAESWLMEVMPEDDKNLPLHSRSSRGLMSSIHPSMSSRKIRIDTSFDGSVVQEITLGKHKIRLEAAT